MGTGARNLTAAIATALLLAFPLATGARADDVTPPAAPIISAEADGWQTSPYFEIGWLEPSGQETPIAMVHYEICHFGNCQIDSSTSWSNDGPGEEQRLEVMVPWPGQAWPYGEYAVRIWLEDQAGNVDPAARSNAVSLLYDNEPPTHSSFVGGDSWLDASEAQLHVAMISYDFAPPASGVAGWAITQDGSLPDTSSDVSAISNAWGMFLVQDLAEGSTTLRARAISGAGVPAPDWAVITRILKVDKTPPSTSATASATSSAWQRDAVTVRLKATDQLDLSGMDPAPIGEPIEGGGYLAYALDGGATHRARGDDAEVGIDVDGHHSLRYRAYDAAGNPSAEKTIDVKVDETAPSAAFVPSPADDPLRLEAVVEDAMSGIAHGEIEMRRVGAETYRPLDTTIESGRLVADLDDDVPDGRYEMRVRVRDHAGNETTSGDRVDGRRMEMTLPVRTPTRLRLETRSGPVDNRTRPLVRGRLTTRAGRPLRNAVITVLDRSRASGELRPAGSVRTNAKGNFRHRAPARRPSRSIRYSYAGTRTIRPVSREVAVRVRAGVTLSVNRTWLLNGQAVVFRGRLASPVPKGGKVVALQARKRSGWVTFGTPRANRRGAFKLRYRFVSTTGLQKYRFRAVAVREGAYPYDTGASRTVGVTVRGL